MSAKQNSPQNTSRNICVDNIQPMTNSTAEKSSFWPQSKSIVFHTVWKSPKKSHLNFCQFLLFGYLFNAKRRKRWEIELSDKLFFYYFHMKTVQNETFFFIFKHCYFWNIIHTVWNHQEISDLKILQISIFWLFVQQ